MAKKVTSKKVATQASNALRDGRSSDRTKSIAGSALSQREKKKIRVFYVSIRLCHSNYGIAYLHTNQIMIL